MGYRFFIQIFKKNLTKTSKSCTMSVEQQTIQNMKMNRINFDSIVHRDAYRNGFTNYKLMGGMVATLSSTFHKGCVEVSYDEDDGYIVYDVVSGVEFVVGAEANLATKLRELSEFYMNLVDV